MTGGGPVGPAGGDRIALTGIRVFGRHGVYEHERRDGQEFVVDVVLTVDTAEAAASDDVADTVDYGALATDLAEVVAGPPMNLLETLAERLARTCLERGRVREVRVTVHKPQAPVAVPFTDVSVSITRSRR